MKFSFHSIFACQWLANLVLVCVVMPLSLLLQADVAAAQAVPATWVRWLLEADFRGDHPVVLWHIVYGIDNQRSGQPLVTGHLPPLDLSSDCTINGNVQMKYPYASPYAGNTAAYFDGRSNLACRLPDFVPYIQLLKKQGVLSMDVSEDGDCSCSDPDAAIYADLQLAMTPSSRQSLFFHPDFDFALHPVAANQVESQLWLNQQLVAPTFSWAIDPAGNQLYSGSRLQYEVAPAVDLYNSSWLSQPELQDAIAQSTPHNFVHWASSNSYLAFDYATSFAMTTMGTEVLIGHNPLTGDGFEGALAYLLVDPPCRSH